MKEELPVKVLVAVQPSARRRHSKLRHRDACRRTPAHGNASRPEHSVVRHDDKPERPNPKSVTKPSRRRPSSRPGRHASERAKVARFLPHATSS
jgi:hypothetical protein